MFYDNKKFLKSIYENEHIIAFAHMLNVKLLGKQRDT